MRLLMIDNFDSFTYNLVQYLRELGAVVDVVRNDCDRPLPGLLAEYDGLVVSPGPCAPSQAGISIAALRLAGEPETALPALGVCLGHQALAEAYGGRVTRANAPMLVWHDGSPPFEGVPSPTEVMRYHSLIMDPADVPESLRVTARTSDGEIMGLAHRTLPIYGVQFHPESIATADGKAMLACFLSMVREHPRTAIPAVGATR
jgi:anthranilate synthase/aminodeoxychorismate synthase-like glutamine amidotransferase